MSSPGIFSPGTGAALCELGCSVVTSLGEAQPEIRKAIAKNEATETAARLIINANLAMGEFDASSGVR
jgi:hypothetical protein